MYEFMLPLRNIVGCKASPCSLPIPENNVHLPLRIIEIRYWHTFCFNKIVFPFPFSWKRDSHQLQPILNQKTNFKFKLDRFPMILVFFLEKTEPKEKLLKHKKRSKNIFLVVYLQNEMKKKKNPICIISIYYCFLNHKFS